MEVLPWHVLSGLDGMEIFTIWNGAFQRTYVNWSIDTWYLVTIAFDTATRLYDFVIYNQDLTELVRVEGIAFGNPSTPIPSINAAVFYTSSGYLGDGFGDDFSVRKWCGADVSTAVGAERDLGVAPIAEDQSASTDEDTPIAITLTASDADGDPLTYAVLSNPYHGY